MKWHTYKLRVRHQLKPTDFERRGHFSEWLIEKCGNRRFLANFVIGDEAGFAMNGEVNSQNVVNTPLKENVQTSITTLTQVANGAQFGWDFVATVLY